MVTARYRFVWTRRSASVVCQGITRDGPPLDFSACRDFMDRGHDLPESPFFPGPMNPGLIISRIGRRAFGGVSMPTNRGVTKHLRSFIATCDHFTASPLARQSSADLAHRSLGPESEHRREACSPFGGGRLGLLASMPRVLYRLELKLCTVSIGALDRTIAVPASRNPDLSKRAGFAMLTPSQRLLKCIAQGDCRAFTEFYDQHSPRVFGMLVRLLGSRDDAEDTLQETFWQVWRSADDYDAERAKPEVWLLTIARSRAMDCLRRRPRTVNVAIEEALTIAKDPCEGLVQDESRQRLQNALACLPDEQRAVVVLSFFSGWTHVQIADQLGVPLGTAKTRIALGMKRLRSLRPPGHKE